MNFSVLPLVVLESVPMPNLADIAGFLNLVLDLDSFPAEERNVIYASSARSIRRLGFALEPWSTLPSWLEHEELDAIFLHRHNNLDRDELPQGRGVLACGLPFDERLTLGFVPRLADILGLRSRSPMGDRNSRPIGMIGELPKMQTVSQWKRVLTDMYGGIDDTWSFGNDEIIRIAIANTITPALVQEAANRDVQAFITPQLREQAQSNCKTATMTAFGVGQKRVELWGLRALSGMIRERWSGVRTAIFEDRGQ